MLKVLALVLFLVPSVFSAVQFEIVTFNVRWLGVTVDNPRDPKPTPRNPALIKKQITSVADFIKTVVRPQSLVVFEEVVDLNALRVILPPNWTCDGYRSANPHHQHTVICVSGQYRIVNTPYDNNKVIEEVATDAVWSRPGVRADIVDATGKRLLRVVGLHLKSAPEFSKERQRQIAVVAQDLRKAPPIPTILTGDFNSYFTKETGLPYDDIVYFEQILKQSDPSFRHLPHKEPFTYRSMQHRSQFDQIYYNNGIKVLKGPDVFDVCSQNGDGQGYLNFKYYFENVSDHCPVKAIIEIAN